MAVAKGVSPDEVVTPLSDMAVAASRSKPLLGQLDLEAFTEMNQVSRAASYSMVCCCIILYHITPYHSVPYCTSITHLK